MPTTITTALTTATDLDALLQAMRAAHDAQSEAIARGDDDTAAEMGDAMDRLGSDLPTWGGEDIPNVPGPVWSWDGAQAIVGACWSAEDLQLVAIP